MNVKEIEQLAKEEVEKEKTEQAKKMFKDAFKRLDLAKQVVKNIERELQDLTEKLQNDKV